MHTSRLNRREGRERAQYESESIAARRQRPPATLAQYLTEMDRRNELPDCCRLFRARPPECEPPASDMGVLSKPSHWHLPQSVTSAPWNDCANSCWDLGSRILCGDGFLCVSGTPKNDAENWIVTWFSGLFMRQAIHQMGFASVRPQIRKVPVIWDDTRAPGSEPAK